MRKPGFIALVVILLAGLGGNSLKSQDIAPQIWTNAGVSWNINDKYSWRNTAAYNVLLSGDFSWFEFTLTSTGVFKFQKFFQATFGVYMARTKQSLTLNSYEVRPFAGFNATTNRRKRWVISNRSRFEMRQLIYSDISHSLSFRFRNRTYVAVALNKPAMNINRNRIFAFGYFEAFFNFGQEVRERFFNQFKYKLGLGYRLNESWAFDVGFIYQDAKNNVGIPSQLPLTVITNYVLDWGVVYIIGASKKDQK